MRAAVKMSPAAVPCSRKGQAEPCQHKHPGQEAKPSSRLGYAGTAEEPSPGPRPAAPASGYMKGTCPSLTPLSRHWGLTKLLQMLQGEGLLEALVPSEVGCTPRPARFCGGAAREAAWLDELCAPLWQPCPSFFHPRSQRKRCLSSASPWRNLKVLQLCLHNASKCCALPDCKIFRIEARGASLPPGFGSHTMQTSRLCTVRHWEKTEIKTSCRA